MKNIKDIKISDARVLVRVDFNVPLDEMRNIRDDARIRAALPTLKYALEQGAKLIIASHMGRPKGKVVPELSLEPVAKKLGVLLEENMEMAPDCIGREVIQLVDMMEPGSVLLLENLRFHAGEQKNDDEFAEKLAALCDVFVNDAFAVSHRSHASVVGITKYVSDSVAGFLLQRELDYFKKAMEDPARPLAAIVGGAKVSSKLAALENVMNHVDKIIVGGAMANTFLKSNGYDVGQSKVEDDLVETAGSIMKRAAKKGIKFYLPVDVVAANALSPDAEIKNVPIQEIPADWMVLDIGPATSLLYSEVLSNAGTIVWNGPMGVFEMEPFSKGTMNMVDSVAGSDALTIIGGGDTDVAVHQSGKSDKITYISTGGGAFLALMEGKVLPAVAVLDEAG